MSESENDGIEARVLELLGSQPEELRSEIVEMIRRMVGERTRAERDRCIRICRYRAELWRRTPSAESPAGREEARARANEAIYLADFIEKGEELFPEADA